MIARPKRLKVRDARAALKAGGAEPVRVNGSHEIWRLPNGATVPIVVNFKNAELSGNVLSVLRRACAVAGLAI